MRQYAEVGKESFEEYDPLDSSDDYLHSNGSLLDQILASSRTDQNSGFNFTKF